MRAAFMRAIAMCVMATAISAGAASAAPEQVRIPPPPVPGARHLPTLTLPGPPIYRVHRRGVRRYYVRGHYLRRGYHEVWIPGHWVRVWR